MKGKGKAVELEAGKHKWYNKGCFLKGRSTYKFLDCTVTSELFLTLEARKNNQKWLLTKEGKLKNTDTELFLTSEENGDLYLDLEKDDIHQLWTYENTNDKLMWVIKNKGNSLFLRCNKMSQLILGELDEKSIEKPFLWFIDVKRGKK